MRGSEEKGLCWREDGDSAGCRLRKSRENRPPGALSRVWGSAVEDQLRGGICTSQGGMTRDLSREKEAYQDLSGVGRSVGNECPREQEGGGTLRAVEVEDKHWLVDMLWGSVHLKGQGPR